MLQSPCVFGAHIIRAADGINLHCRWGAKLSWCWVLVFLLLARVPLTCQADSVVVFNEVMFHPPANEAAFEWVELHNQMAVDVDLSGWSITGGVQFQFPEGTIIPGGGYLVVAGSPPDLQTATGLTNVLGPMDGRLSNAGDSLQLRNNNDRLMDELDYGVEGDWPVGPDGSGVSLAKRDEDSASASSANWTVSALTGGTPGRRNFALQPFEITQSAPLTMTGPWKYHVSTGLDDTWRQLGFDDTPWPSGAALLGDGQVSPPVGDLEPIPSLFSTGMSEVGTVLAPGSPDPHYLLTRSAQATPTPPPLPATVIQNHPAWAANDAASSWIGPVNPGTSDVAAGEYHYRTTFNLDGFQADTASLTLNVGADNRLNSVLLNGVSKNISYVGFSTLSGPLTITSGFSSGTNVLDFLTANDSTTPNPAGFRVQLRGLARKQFKVQTPLAPGAASYCFRSSFVLSGPPQQTAVQLNTVLADGAVFYLNGTEVLRLNLPSGPIDAATMALSNVVNPAVLGPFPLPNASLVTGTNVLAVEVHRGPSAVGGVLFGADLALTTTNILVPPPVTLVFNEFTSATGADFWIELMNYGTAPLDLAGCVLARRGGTTEREYVFPPQVLQAGAFLQVPRSVLGFSADPGDRLFLYAPGRRSVLDAVVAKREPRGRWPDGSGRWWQPSLLTPGGPNEFAFHDDVVINEIFYHAPVSSAQDESWVELFNRGSRAADLTGWRLADDIDFLFPAGTTIPPDGYLVVAKNVLAMRTKYPEASVAGPFDKALGRKGGRIELLDATGNLADEVRFYDDKPWPAYADGGGSSLELRDPWADNSKPEAWAASVEGARSGWSNYTYRAVASGTLGPTQWKEFVIGLLEAGECLVDDLSVVENPSGTPVSLLQNGSFETGLSAWRALGNHRHSRVEPDPDNPNNHVLHLVAGGPTDHLHNHLETTLANGRSVVNGREYEVSYRAKWLAGNPRLNTRLYFNRVAKTTALAMPEEHGTPGRPNSVRVPNLGPTCAGLAHSSVVPKAREPVTVRVRASDAQGVNSVTLWWTTNQAAWKTTPMVPESPSSEPGYTNYLAVLPGQSAGTLVQFFVQAADTTGAVANYPAGGTNSRALFKVDDGKALMPQLHRFRLLMTPADVAWLHAPTNVMSDDRIGLTVIYDEQQVFYDAGVHLQSSERGRNDSSRVGFTIRFNSDQLLRGVQDTISIDRSGGYSGRGGRHDELLLWHAVNHAGGLLGIHCDLVQCFAPRAQEDGTGLLRMSAFDNNYFDAQYPNGGEGNLYKLELIYYPTTTTDGNPQSPKLPQPDDVINVEIQNWGNDPENYRWIFVQENHADRDDYSPIMALSKAFSLSGTALDTQTSLLLDTDQWMRTLAFKAFTGDVDTFTYGLNHNWKIYFRPGDGKALGLLWDMDFSYVQPVNYPAPGTGSANTYKVATLPNNRRRFFSHVLDLSTTTINAAYLRPWAQHYAGLVGQDWSGALDYLQQRANYLRSTLPQGTPFRITSNGGRDFSISTNQVTLTGTAPLTVDDFLVNGLRLPVTWTSLTNWSLTLPLSGYANGLVLQGLDHRGNPLPNTLDSITVTNTGAFPLQPVVINEWMADNSAPDGFPCPLDGSYSDWFELYNPNPVPVDLGGYYLTDRFDEPGLWRIPPDTRIGPRGFLLVWADNTGAGLDPNGDLHAGFALNKGGDALGLYGPDGTPQHSVIFGPQLRNVSEGLFPDGATNAVCAMSQRTPGAPNQPCPGAAPQLTGIQVGSDGTVTLAVSVIPGRVYRLEYTGALTSGQWLPLGEDWIAQSPVLTVSDVPLPHLPCRFYRVVLLQK